MKQIKTIMLIVLLMLVGRASADNLTIEKVFISPGETKQIAIELINVDKQYEAFQFDLMLPEGINIAKNDKGNLDVSLNPERKVDHSLTIRLQGDNSYRFMSYSMDDKAFKGNNGALVYIMLEAEKSLSLGDKDIMIKNQVMSDITGEVIKWVDAIFQISVVESSTVTAKSYERIYGEANPGFEYEVEGAALEGTPEITCEATKTSSVGTYPIVITKGTVTNYNVTYVNGTLTVTKAPLTITAKDYTIKQGEALPTFEATYEGFKNDETEAVLTKQPTITTTATSASGPGDYYITVSGAEAQNYEISYVGGKLTIELGYIPGDANGDGLVNVTDIVATVNYIMEKPSEGFNKAAADLNGDGEINVTDIVKMVSIIMSGDAARRDADE